MPQCYLTAIKNHTEKGHHWSLGGESLGFQCVACDSCGTSLSGERYHATQIKTDSNLPWDERVVLCRICEDCLMFHANGEEPEIFCENCEECSGPLHQYSQF